MSLATIMLEQLAAARRIVEDGHEMVPAWRIATAEGTFLILTRFDTSKNEQRKCAQYLISRFMVWKMATSFVLTAKPGSAPRRRATATRRCSPLAFRATSGWRPCSASNAATRSASEPMWLAPHQVDAQYFAMLPTGAAELSAEEATELARIFGKNGELRAERLS